MESSIVLAPGNDGGPTVLETVVELSRSSRDYTKSAPGKAKNRKAHTLICNRHDLL